MFFCFFRARAAGFASPTILCEAVADSGSSSDSPVLTRNSFRVSLDGVPDQEVVSFFV